MTLMRERYEDYGPTLASEMLLEYHGFKVGRETLHQWMIEDGPWLSRKQNAELQPEPGASPLAGL